MKKLMEMLGQILNVVINAAAHSGGADVDSLKLSDGMLGIPRLLWDYVAIIGVGLTLMYFLFEMNQKYALEGRDMNLKTIGVPFLKFVIAFAILSHGAGIVSTMLKSYNGMIEYVGSTKFQSLELTVDDVGKYTEKIADIDKISTDAEGNDVIENIVGTFIEHQMAKANVITTLIVIIVALFMMLLSTVLKLVWDYKAITFKLEFLFRVGITPIAFADIYNGMSSNGIRWLKGFIGMALYGASFILIPMIGNAMMLTSLYSSLCAFVVPDGDSPSMISTLVSLAGCFVVPFAELGVLSAIRQLTKEVI